MSASLVVEGAIARLTLERPQALNALDRQMAEAIEHALETLEHDRQASVLIVSGRGRAFCAGNDVKEMPGLSPSQAEALSRRWQSIMDRFARLPQVTIAAVHGYALGGGCMLAAAQDLRLADASARFGLPEVTLGFNPSYGITRLLDLLGGAHARYLLYTGRTIDAAEAFRIGLCTEVVPDGALEDAVARLAAEIARHPRGGLSASKRIVADIRAGSAGGEAQAYAATLGTDRSAQARLADFIARSTERRSLPDPC